MIKIIIIIANLRKRLQPIKMVLMTEANAYIHGEERRRKEASTARRSQLQRVMLAAITQ